MVYVAPTVRVAPSDEYAKPTIRLGPASVYLSDGYTEAPPGENVAPSVAITSPSAGGILVENNTFTITGTCSDLDGTVSSVNVKLDGSSIGLATIVGGNWSLDYTPLNGTAGSHTLTATATDDDGATNTTAGTSITIRTFEQQVVAEFSPVFFITANGVTVDADNLEGGTRVSAADDIGSGDTDLSTATQNDEPELLTDASSDKYLEFNAGDGSNGDILVNSTANPISGLSACTFVHGFRLTSAAGNQLLWELVPTTATATASLLYMTGGTYRMYISSNVVYAVAGTADTTNQCFVHVFDGAGSTNADKLKRYTNGSAVTLTYSGTVPSSIQNNALCHHSIGSRIYPSRSIPAYCDYYFCIIINSALDATQLASLHSRIRAEYGWW